LKRTESASPLKPRIALIAIPYSSKRYDVVNPAITRFLILLPFAEEERQDSPKALFGGLKSTAPKCAPVAKNIQTSSVRPEMATVKGIEPEKKPATIQKS
jgi:hypothetical protein